MQMDDDRWTGLNGGYRITYDPRDALRRLEEGDTAAWQELWQELHHQGDVGEASYAAVPQLIRVHRSRGVADWNTYALIAAVEEARHSDRNPPMPEWLREDYDAAWRDLQSLAMAEFTAADSDELVRCILAVLALSKGKVELGRICMLTPNEWDEILTKYA